ncbi:MAG: hypothetical protein HOV80_22140 [Polyangiaceae bacterium]|nr:hypothetical protein [Polyangiaceae bacterium]
MKRRRRRQRTKSSPLGNMADLLVSGFLSALAFETARRMLAWSEEASPAPAQPKKKQRPSYLRLVVNNDRPNDADADDDAGDATPEP